MEHKEGHTYRLPTTEEWHWAALAGSPAKYYFGNESDGLDDHAWHRGHSRNESHPVGEKKPNPWGLFDRYGNVRGLAYLWERNGRLVDEVTARGGPTDKDRIYLLRGSFYDFAASTIAWNSVPSIGYSHFGSRVVLAGDLKAGTGNGR